MNEIDPKYYNQLFERVRVIIQSPRYDEAGTLLLHIYKSDTWGTPTSWTAYLLDSPENDAPVHINRVQWKSKRDMKRMNVVTQPAEPTLVHAQATVTAAEYESLMAVGRRIRVPLFDVPPLNGIDGSYYGMVIPPSPSSPIQTQLELEWWEHGPTPWQPFTGWAFKMIELFQKAF